jgi:hypothetical protein
MKWGLRDNLSLHSHTFQVNARGLKFCVAIVASLAGLEDLATNIIFLKRVRGEWWLSMWITAAQPSGAISICTVHNRSFLRIPYPPPPYLL